LGKIISVETYFLGDIHSWPSISKFHFNKQEGGGALFEMGCHHIDLLSYCMGNVKSVKATIESSALETIDDKAEVNLEFQNGAIAKSHVSWVSSIPKYELSITGEKGEITIKDEDFYLYLKDKLVFGRA